MRFNFKNLVKNLFAGIICLLSISCSFVPNDSGNIKFNLPYIQYSNTSNYSSRSAISNGGNKTQFKIILTNSFGRVVYEEYHDAGTMVYIDNIVAGKYEISMEAVTHSDIYEGREHVHVKPGKGSEVQVRLSKNPINSELENNNSDTVIPEDDNHENVQPDVDTEEPEIKPETPDVTPDVPDGDNKEYGYFTGSIDTSNIEDLNSFELNIFIYKYGDDRTPVYQNKLNQETSYETGLLEVGKYTLKFEGKDDKASYSCFIPSVSNMKPGKNIIGNFTLTKFLNTDAANNHIITIKFTNDPNPKETVKVRLSDINGYERFSTIISSDLVCRFRDVEKGTYKLNVEGATWGLKDFPISVNGDEHFDIQLQQNKVDITPEPENGVFVVDPSDPNSSDINNTGTRPFKTLAQAVKANNAKTIFILSDTTETETIKLPNSISVKSAGNSLVTINSSAQQQAINLDSGVTASIDGISIISSAAEFTIKIGDSGNLTLGKSVKVGSSGKSRNAISLGSSGTLTVSSPNVINSNDYIRVLSGGKINVLPEFNNIEGSINIDKTGVGAEQNSQILLYNGSAEATEGMKKASAKFTINNNYSINENGKIQ